MAEHLQRLLTVSQAVEEMRRDGAKGVGNSTLRREIAAGRLRASRIGRCLRITDDELARWIASTQGLSIEEAS